VALSKLTVTLEKGANPVPVTDTEVRTGSEVGLSSMLAGVYILLLIYNPF